MKQHGKVLWFDRRDGYGIIQDAAGNEIYVSCDCIDRPEYMESGIAVSFEPRRVSNVDCAFSVNVSLSSALERAESTLSKLRAYPAEQLREGAVAEQLRARDELLQLLKGA